MLIKQQSGVKMMPHKYTFKGDFVGIGSLSDFPRLCYNHLYKCKWKNTKSGNVVKQKLTEL